MHTKKDKHGETARKSTSQADTLSRALLSWSEQ